VRLSRLLRGRRSGQGGVAEVQPISGTIQAMKIRQPANSTVDRSNSVGDLRCCFRWSTHVIVDVAQHHVVRSLYVAAQTAGKAFQMSNASPVHRSE
jgi:hypothetical protein